MRSLVDSFSTRVKFKMELPESLWNVYEEQAIAHGRSVEDEIEERLKLCQEYQSSRPLYFTDADRVVLEKAFGHVLAKPSQVLDRLGNLLNLRVGNIKVELPDRLQTRLRTRVFKGHSYEEVVQREVIQGLERYCGLRP